jgi:heme-degrading monooxygenase HmoA
MSPASETNLISISIFTPKPAHFDTFVATQIENLPRLGRLSGSRGAQFYVAKDGRHAILVSFFDDEVALRDFRESDAFREHRDRLQTLIESNENGFYTLAYSREVEPA